MTTTSPINYYPPVNLSQSSTQIFFEGAAGLLVIGILLASFHLFRKRKQGDRNNN